MTKSLSSDEVVLVDLRDTEPVAARQRFFEVLRAAPYGGDEERRALIIDDAARLEQHHPVFEAIFRSREVDTLICLAVGEPDDRAEGHALKASPVLSGDRAAILWVGDETGVAWRMDTSTAVRPVAAVQNDGVPALRRLINALCTREVFDQVLRHLRLVPDGVASPGVRIVAGQIELTTLLVAQRRAVATVAGRMVDDATTERAGPSLDGGEVLLGRIDLLPSEYSPLRGDSDLGQLSQQCETLCRESAQLAGRMEGLSGLLGPDRPGRHIYAKLREAGRAAERYYEAVADLFDYGDAGGGLDAGRRDELERQGISWSRFPGLDPADVVRRLSEAVDTGIGRHSVRMLIGWLRIVSDRATPQGSAAYLDRLDQLGGRPAIGRLTTPPPFVLADAPPATLAAVFGCCLLASLAPAPLGWLTGVSVAVIWLLVALLALVRQPVPDGERGLRALGRPMPLWHPLVAATGVGAGQLVSRIVMVPTPLAVVAAVLSGISLLVVLSVWWTGAVRRWRRGLALADMITFASRQDALLREVAVLEWVLADQRRYLANVSRALAGALSEIAEAMDGYLDDASSDDKVTGYLGVSVDQDTMGDLQVILNADVADAVWEVLAPCWQMLRTGALEQARVGVADDIRHLLSEHWRHLELHNVHERPRFARPQPDGALPKVPQIWGALGWLNEVVSTPRHGLLAQMCTAPDLALLQPTARQARVVRFAPRSAQDVVVEGGIGAELDDLVWTSTGHLAGVVRLVPLRPGAVDLVWPEEGDNEYAI